MKQLFKIFFWGMLISFLGSLPLGTMNVAATNISVKDGVNAAMIYALGSMIVELIYVRLSLIAMAWINRQQKIFRLFEWLTVFLILALAIGNFIAAVKMSGLGSALPVSTKYPFGLGALLSATNPLHIPFWFGWSTLLLNRKILLPCSNNYNWYAAGIGVGTMAGFALFIYGGSYMVQELNANQNMLNWVIGIVLLITAFIQVYKIRSKPAEVVISNASS